MRTLQSKHDKLIGLATKKLYVSIENDAYKDFETIVNFGITYYKQKPKLRERILSYYKKSVKEPKIDSLEYMLKGDRSVTKYYTIKCRWMWVVQESKNIT